VGLGGPVDVGMRVRVLCGASIVLCSVLAASPSRADKPRRHEAPPALAQSLTGESKEAYLSGELLFTNGDFNGAVAKFQQAYDLSKDPRLLFDMAVAEKGLHAYARMERHLEQYSRETGPNAAPEDKAAVDAALAAIRNLVGSLTVDVTPPGATVTVDGQPAGTAPLEGPLLLDLGAHVLVVQKADFDPITKAVDIKGGTSSSLSIVLVQKVHTAHLVVSSEAGATIVIDGQAASGERFDGPVTPGSHDVRVSAPGRLAYRVSIDLRDGETRMLDVSLHPEAHAPVWPWIVGGAVLAAGAAVGGYFLFKPHDETSPVPDGSFGPAVRLSTKFE
jgi:hypothetical protein